MSKHAFIIGGTGQIGWAAARRLLAQGWRITISSRRDIELPSDLLSQDIARIKLDRDQPGALAAVLKDGADVIIDVVAYHEGHAQQLLEVQQDVGAFIIISSSSVYVDEQGRSLDEAAQKGFPVFSSPINETQPTIHPQIATYSANKVAVETAMLDQSQRPVIIVRPGAIYGPYSTHPREWWFVKRMLDGRDTIPLAFGGQNRFHTCAATNIAELMVTVLNKPDNYVLNIADPHALTVEEIGKVIAKHMDWHGEFLLLNDDAMLDNQEIGRSPWSVPMQLVLSTETAESLGYSAVTDYEQAAAECCRWLCTQHHEEWQKIFPLLAAYPYNLFDYSQEDLFLKSYS